MLLRTVARVRVLPLSRLCSSLRSTVGAGATPSALVQDSLSAVPANITFALRAQCVDAETTDAACYHFTAGGKAFRPTVVLLASRAINLHARGDRTLLPAQQRVAEIAEMIHTASLLHDDVIDGATLRRGAASVQAARGQRCAVQAGVYLLSVSSLQLARLRDARVVEVLSRVLVDLVRGELMQLGSGEQPSERFKHYIDKTYKKTASLIAHSCEAVAILGGACPAAQRALYEYGRSLGIAFQLVDDLLDFTATQDALGKPAAADLRLGLATAPLLFAASRYPELEPLIMRRFSQPGDVERAWERVLESDGLHDTRVLAEQHCAAAADHVRLLQPSEEREALIELTQRVLTRSH